MEEEAILGIEDTKKPLVDRGSAPCRELTAFSKPLVCGEGLAASSHEPNEPSYYSWRLIGLGASAG